jgi:hypothetical protein
MKLCLPGYEIAAPLFLSFKRRLKLPGHCFHFAVRTAFAPARFFPGY